MRLSVLELAPAEYATNAFSSPEDPDILGRA